MKTLSGISLVALACFWVNAYADSFHAIVDLSPRFELSLPVSGVVDRITVTAGQRVKKGETILSLDDAPFKADRALMQSRVAFQQARLAESKRDLNHQQELYERTVLSTVELENAELRLKRDTALLESATARLSKANYALAHSQLKAPFDALILSVQVNEGQTITNALQSRTLVTLARQDAFTARFNVSAEMLDKINIEKPVKVLIDDAQYKASISAISYIPEQTDEADSISGEKQYSVDAVFITKKGEFPLGKAANVVFD